MKITEDNFYDKIKELKCGNCNNGQPEYFFNFNNEKVPLCETCTFDALKNEHSELFEIANLDPESEEDIEYANKLWEEQEHLHK